MAKRVGIIPRLDNDEALRIAVDLSKSLRRKRLEIVPEADFARRFKLPGSREISQIEADVVVTIGGDGTVLKACMHLPHPDTPIIAVNMGRRGYLTDVHPKNAVRAVEAFITGRCVLDRRQKLAVVLDGRETVEGLNELVLSSGTPSKMLHLSIGINNELPLQFRGDGLIVSTPTGSTAYALSARGPVIDKSVNAFAVTFICPLENLSPFVVSMQRSINISLIDPRLKGTLVVDGRFQREVMSETTITVKQANHPAVFARMGKPPSLRNLMRLSELERYA